MNGRFAGRLGRTVLVLPNAVWQIQHGFPSLGFYRNATMNNSLSRR